MKAEKTETSKKSRKRFNKRTPRPSIAKFGDMPISLWPDPNPRGRYSMSGGGHE